MQKQIKRLLLNTKPARQGMTWLRRAAVHNAQNPRSEIRRRRHETRRGPHEDAPSTGTLFKKICSNQDGVENEGTSKLTEDFLGNYQSKQTRAFA
jgi:hypothetical protein